MPQALHYRYILSLSPAQRKVKSDTFIITTPGDRGQVYPSTPKGHRSPELSKEIKNFKILLSFSLLGLSLAIFCFKLAFQNMPFFRRARTVIVPLHIPAGPRIEFDGSGDIDDFIDKYVNMGQTAGWNESKLVIHLGDHLVGTARQFLDVYKRIQASIGNIPVHQVKLSWHELEKELREMFSVNNEPAMLEKRLKETLYDETESPESFYFGMLILMLRLDPLLSESSKISFLLRNIPPLPRYIILMNDPKGTEDILVGLQNHSRFRNILSVKPESAEVYTLTDTKEDKVTVQKQRNPPFPKVRDGQGHIICYKCKSRGHQVKACHALRQ